MCPRYDAYLNSALITRSCVTAMPSTRSQAVLRPSPKTAFVSRSRPSAGKLPAPSRCAIDGRGRAESLVFDTIVVIGAGLVRAFEPPDLAAPLAIAIDFDASELAACVMSARLLPLCVRVELDPVRKPLGGPTASPP